MTIFLPRLCSRVAGLCLLYCREQYSPPPGAEETFRLKAQTDKDFIATRSNQSVSAFETELARYALPHESRHSEISYGHCKEEL